ncbi:MAG: electron transfer flavoprotein subunit alpha/FixB family protein, partial [Actinobacteria bacterium]|nr:electron transfer flavoprotein subunit alpha/FixB family protein [Actinomycetota bacterium]
MHEIFVLAEHREGELREITLEMLTLAGQVAADSGGKVTAVLFG